MYRYMGFRCVVIFFWSSGIMYCRRFTFEKRLPLMQIGRQWYGIFHYQWWTTSIKPRLLFPPCKLCFLGAFLFSDNLIYLQVPKRQTPYNVTKLACNIYSMHHMASITNLSWLNIPGSKSTVIHTYTLYKYCFVWCLCSVMSLLCIIITDQLYWLTQYYHLIWVILKHKTFSAEHASKNKINTHKMWMFKAIKTFLLYKLFRSFRFETQKLHKSI